MRREEKSRSAAEAHAVPGRPGRRPGWRLLLLALGILALAVLVIGCSSNADGNANGNGGENPEFPSWVYNSAVTLAGYKAAVKNHDILYAIPCYCGCGVSQGHTSLLDCFFKEDGSFNDHASNCHICADQAVDVGKWANEGVPLKEIRSRTDAKYSEFGPGTDTPPVQ